MRCDHFAYDGISNDHIRLIDFDDERSQLSLRISSHRLVSAPSYVAISYRWGQASDDRMLRLNGKPKPVRAELYQALLWLRTKYSHSPIWVDALCINQDDTAERTQQVAMMNKIFRHANLTAVWLGQLQVAPARLYGASDRLPGHVALAMAAQAYWSRTWIFQEFLLSWRILIHASPHTVSARNGASTLGSVEQAKELYTTTADELFAALTGASLVRTYPRGPASSVLRRLRPELGPSAALTKDHINISTATNVLLIRLTSHPIRYMSMYSLRHTINVLQCGDPRDSVFALIGLLHHDDEFRTVFPDYSLSEGEVFLKTLIQFRGNRRMTGLQDWTYMYANCEILVKAFQVATLERGTVLQWLKTLDDPELPHAARAAALNMELRVGTNGQSKPLHLRDVWQAAFAGAQPLGRARALEEAERLAARPVRTASLVYDDDDDAYDLLRAPVPYQPKDTRLKSILDHAYRTAG